MEYKNTPKERMYDVLAVEYMRHMYVARNDDFELEFNATLSYMQSGTQKTAEYGGADTDLLYVTMDGSFFVFRYPLPEGDVSGLKLSATLHFKTTVPGGMVDTFNTFMHQSGGGDFSFINLVPGGSQGADYVTGPFVNDPDFSMYLCINSGANNV